jgi:hydroxymethylglutaryl-CoA reductase
MPDLTEEEYDALDEQYTRNPPKVSGDGKSGFFMKHKGNIIIVNDITAAYLRAHADAAHKTPSELVDEMIKERIAAAL